MLARYQLWPRACLSVCFCHKSVFSRNVWTDQAVFCYGDFLRSTLQHVFKNICVLSLWNFAANCIALENLATASHGKITAEVRAVLCLTVTYFLFQHILPLGSQFQLCSPRYVRLLYFSYTLYFMGLVAWHSGRTSVSGRRTFPVLRSTCS